MKTIIWLSEDCERLRSFRRVNDARYLLLVFAHALDSYVTRLPIPPCLGGRLR